MRRTSRVQSNYGRDDSFPITMPAKMRAMVAKNAGFFKRKYQKKEGKNLIFIRNLYFLSLKKALRRQDRSASLCNCVMRLASPVICASNRDEDGLYNRLTLGELWLFTCFTQADFLALYSSCITCYETSFTQSRT